MLRINCIGVLNYEGQIPRRVQPVGGFLFRHVCSGPRTNLAIVQLWARAHFSLYRLIY